jgi:hypothetical protein
VNTNQGNSYGNNVTGGPGSGMSRTGQPATNNASSMPPGQETGR